MSPTVAKQRKLVRVRRKQPPAAEHSSHQQGNHEPAPLLHPAEGHLESGRIASEAARIQDEHLLVPDMPSKPIQLLFQNSFPPTFEGRLRQGLTQCYAPLSVAIGEGKTLQMLSSVVGYLIHFPKKLLERDGLSKASPSVEMLQAALLRMAWKFVMNGDEDSPHELRKMMRFPCSKQEQQEIHTLEIAIIGWSAVTRT